MKRGTRWLSAIWTILWKAGLLFILWGVLLAPVILPFATMIRRAQLTSPLQLRLVFDVVTALTLLTVTWFMAHFIDHRPFMTLGFFPDHMIRDLLLGLSLGAGWLALSVAVLWLARCVQVRPEGVLSSSVLAWSGAALLFNTVAQEVLARSYIFQTIRSQSNAAVAVTVSAILFMAYHAGAYHGAWLPAFNVFAAGILFGVAYHLTGNLWLPIAMHFAWNFLLGPVLGLAVSGNTELKSGWQLLAVQGPAGLTGGGFGMEGGLVVTLTTLFGVGALFFLFRRQTVSGRTLR
jgi:membrane protease YdiL (CAAX protease family)